MIVFISLCSMPYALFFQSLSWGGGMVPTSSRQISSMARIMLIGRMEKPTWKSPTAKAMGS
jgi:hypothetical protein